MIGSLIYILIFFIIIYCGGFVFDFFCELRQRRLFMKKQQAIKGVHQAGHSMAVLHAKIFKIETDYQTITEIIEKRRRFIRLVLLHQDRRLLSK